MNPRSTLGRLRGLRSRRGSILVLAAVGMVILIVAAAFSVDIAYMQLTREELHIATDAAAKAAVAKLSLGGTDAEAKAAAIACAAANTVGGGPLVIGPSQITLGKVTYSEGARWPFVAGGTPKIAAKIDVTMSNDTVSGPVKLFFGKAMGTPYFNPSSSSTAAFVRNKVCLCLDRSHSMCFVITRSEDWWYPNIGYHNASFPDYDSTGAKLPPDSIDSRWAKLYTAIEAFLDTVKTVPVETRVGLVTWASDIRSGQYWQSYKVGKITYPASPASAVTTIEISKPNFITDFDTVKEKVSGHSSVVMLGGTNMQAGMDEGIKTFSDNDNTPWNKVMILFSDGLWNEGSNPVTTSAETAKANNIVVHTVGLLTNPNNTTLQDIAAKTGGRYFRATTAAELKAAFQEIARLLPVILTQ